tara:strand:+ start:275 stop:1087 length:813 start_codon:yes stop_codon:yes gene_type:complete
MNFFSILFFIIILLPPHLVAQQEIIEYEAFFLHNKSELTDLEKDKFLVFHDSILANYSISNVLIAGYTNEIGVYEYNHRLSTNRAHYIYQLINNEKLKTPIKVSGKGEIKTISQDDLDQQLIKNRKAVIYYFTSKKDNNYTSVTEFKVGEKMTLKNIGFFGNSPNFLPKYTATLDQLAADLLKNKSYHVEIQGHIYDERNYSDKKIYYNYYPKTLSEDRAKTIYHYLIKSGVDSTRLSYVGFQGRFPLYKKPQDDRRVEIEVVKIIDIED